MADEVKEPEVKQPETKAPETPPTALVVDMEAIRAEARKAVMGEVGSQLKELFNVESFEQLKEKKLTEEGKHKELAEAKAKEASDWKTKHDKLLIESQIKSAAANAVDPDTVCTLLSGRAVLGQDGTVSIDGKPLSTAMDEFLKAKPFLVRAPGGQGSGAPAGGVSEVEDLKAKLDAARKAGNVGEVMKLKTEIAKRGK